MFVRSFDYAYAGLHIPISGVCRDFAFVPSGQPKIPASPLSSVGRLVELSAVQVDCGHRIV